MKKWISAAMVVCMLATAAAQELPVESASFVAGPDVRSFAKTTNITHIDIRSDGIVVTFDKKSGADRWPDRRTPGWDGDLQYSLGMCLNAGGWTCSAPIEAWFGRDPLGGPVTDATVTCPQGYHGQVACNWFYDARWGSLNGYQPAPGEQVGIYVVAGDARNSFNPIRERSNIMLVPFQIGAYDFAVNQEPQPLPPVQPPVVSPPVQPPPPPVQPPVPTPSCPAIDLTHLEGLVLQVNQNVSDGRVENQAFYSSVKSTWQAIGGPFILKYILPALGSALASWQLTKK